jgi:hypothetical protein
MRHRCFQCKTAKRPTFYHINDIKDNLNVPIYACKKCKKRLLRQFVWPFALEIQPIELEDIHKLTPLASDICNIVLSFVPPKKILWWNILCPIHLLEIKNKIEDAKCIRCVTFDWYPFRYASYSEDKIEFTRNMQNNLQTLLNKKSWYRPSAFCKMWQNELQHLTTEKRYWIF